MPNCPKCAKPVYFGERIFSLGKDWHKDCFTCEKCNKRLTSDAFKQHERKPYCISPCYDQLVKVEQ